MLQQSQTGRCLCESDRQGVGCGGFRGGPIQSKSVSEKCKLLAYNLNTMLMVGWEGNYPKAVSHISLCVLLISSPTAVLVCRKRMSAQTTSD